MKSLFSSQIGLVGTVMNMQLDRQNIIAGNLANIDTPNYNCLLYTSPSPRD